MNYGVYTSPNLEIAESERWALAFYRDEERDALGARLYFGAGDEKRLVGVAERRKKEKKTVYAFENSADQVITNDPTGVRTAIGERLPQERDGMELIDRICPSAPYALPTVAQAGIEECLYRWRLGVSSYVGADRIVLTMITGKIEYVFSITPQNTDIYCGASVIIPRPDGMYRQAQYFRLRNLGDNSAPFCGFYAELGQSADWRHAPEIHCENGDCTTTEDGIYWPVKRFSDDEIVLAGCGGDEYVYLRTAEKTEWFGLLK